jgi:Fe-S-cluster containining protein
VPLQAGFDAQQFTDEVKKIAGEAFFRSGAGSGIEATRRIQQYCEEVSAQHIGHDTRIDCRAGCAHCCIVNVSVLLPEAESIAEHLFEQRTSGELLDLYQAIRHLEKQTHHLDEEERIMAREKCAFLSSEGDCSIYPTRPLLCRAITSTDATACKEALAMVAMEENQPILANLLHQQIFETAYTSFSEVLAASGHDSRGYRLTASVRQLLDNKLGTN